MQHFTYKYWSTTQTKRGGNFAIKEGNQKTLRAEHFFKESRRPPPQGFSFFFLLGHGTDLPSLRPVLSPLPAAHKTPLLSYPHLLVICLLQPDQSLPQPLTNAISPQTSTQTQPSPLFFSSSTLSRSSIFTASPSL
jgi:hypothetical protein